MEISFDTPTVIDLNVRSNNSQSGRSRFVSFADPLAEPNPFLPSEDIAGNLRVAEDADLDTGDVLRVTCTGVTKEIRETEDGSPIAWIVLHGVTSAEKV